MATDDNDRLVHHDEPTAPSSQEGMTIQELMILLRRGRWTIAISTIVVVILVGLYTLLSKPVYEATAVFQIENTTKSDAAMIFDFSGTGISTKITNEIEVLRSVSMAEAVAQWLIEKRNIDGDKLHAISIIVDYDSMTSPPRVAPIPVIARRLSKAVDFTPVKESDVIKITARSTDPAEAALIANGYTQNYVDRDLNASRKKSRALREFLQSQLAAKHDQLDTTERQLQDYMRQSGVVSLDEEAKARVEQMAELEAQRDALDVDVRSREESLLSLRRQLAIEEPNVARAMGEANDAYVKLLQEQIAQLEVRRDVAMTQSTQKSITMAGAYQDQFKEIDAQIAQLKRNLRERANNLVGSISPSDHSGGGSDNSGGFVASARQKIIEQSIELDGLKAKRSALNAVIFDAERQFNKIPAKSIELAKLQRARLSTEKLYLLVEEKYNEAAITETSEFGSVNVVDPAAIPLAPVSPKRMLNMAIGLLFGLGVGVGIVLVRGSMDTRVHTPADLRKIGIAPFAVINWIDKKGAVRFNGSGQHVKSRAFDPRLIVHHNPLSPASESYRRLRSAVQDVVTKEPIRTILVTSAGPEEGKSTLVANLAASYANLEERILLIDADFHRPMVHTVFGLPREPGLSDILAGDATFDKVVNKHVLGNVDVLTCGKAEKNPADRLGTSKLTELLGHVRTMYALVLLDSPPLLAVADAGILARITDGMLIVVQSGGTTVEMLEHASELLNKQQHNVLGIVLNGFDAAKAYGSNRHAYKSGYAYYGYGTDGKSKKTERTVRQD